MPVRLASKRYQYNFNGNLAKKASSPSESKEQFNSRTPTLQDNIYKNQKNFILNPIEWRDQQSPQYSAKEEGLKIKQETKHEFINPAQSLLKSRQNSVGSFLPPFYSQQQSKQGMQNVGQRVMQGATSMKNLIGGAMRAPRPTKLEAYK